MREFCESFLLSITWYFQEPSRNEEDRNSLISFSSLHLIGLFCSSYLFLLCPILHVSRSRVNFRSGVIYDTILGSCPILGKRRIDELFRPGEQARTLRQILQINSSIPKSGHEPILFVILAKMVFGASLARKKWLSCSLEKNCVRSPQNRAGSAS